MENPSRKKPSKFFARKACSVGHFARIVHSKGCKTDFILPCAGYSFSEGIQDLKRILERSNETRHPAPGLIPFMIANGPQVDVFRQPFERCFSRDSTDGPSEGQREQLPFVIFVSQSPHHNERLLHRPCWRSLAVCGIQMNGLISGWAMRPTFLR